jgi:5-methyltetrahydropteroyltriglutamate--homocysteine methyltransferase
MDLKAYAPGIYPRSDGLIQATRDLDRGRTTEASVEEQFRRDTQELVRAQEEARLDLLSDGLLRWQDLFRTLAERSDGLQARPLMRFLDTNTFYRAVLVEGKPRLREPVPSPGLPHGRWLATLPSPTAFAHVAGGEASAQALAAGILAPQMESYARDGCALIVLSDPFLAGSNGAGELVAALAELPAGVPIALQLPFADAAPVLAALADAPVTAVGIDFYGTSLDALPHDYPKEILAGVVDARSSAVEDAAEIGRFAEQLLERNPPGLSFGPNGDLQFVPELIARRKLAVLGESRSALAAAA